ncbi:MAG: D-tyrosyl-tRNA(Tyr) deacylase [Melioribacteraceae bacterium]|nr:D-tyrosyl-tRNA(Tyr) deacylase [Melioribacteraceae bacterium]MCF8354418.1 D-tyrosyl-tRNA(Tyr) deacylase [Melioribacteraceae bacterium]MCF8392985.1 D-tyrosyl-tRNA(Tyr) deacylase [Melioribacteraceae bacterium]MCF8417272.1 D-tyrosyl-tRNA(Tyr) deacylase [Melioribacteraceae bacterium]
MRALVQRVSRGSVYLRDLNETRNIGKGFVILLGISIEDSEKEMIFVADKCSNLRVFEDDDEKMNLSIRDVDGEVLIVSQFTLYGDTRKGNRPNFTAAAKPDTAIPLYEKFIKRIKENLGDQKVKSGEFGAMMDVHIDNDGPVTLLIESK